MGSEMCIRDSLILIGWDGSNLVLIGWDGSNLVLIGWDGSNLVLIGGMAVILS